jgi:hypothetical protein
MKCREKARFGDEESAKRHARLWDQAVYQCPECSLWHCTKNAQHARTDSPMKREGELAREASAKESQRVQNQVRIDQVHIGRRKRMRGRKRNS